MGAILAAIIVFAVMGASMALLHAHLEGVDEYNRRAADAADSQRRAVHESLGVGVTGGDGRSYTVHVSNERADPVEIIEVRSMLQNGTVARLPEFAGRMPLAGFGEASIGYDVPEDVNGSVSIVAVTRMGNTFGAEIDTSGPANPARETVSGMGIGSRLEQAEHSGHVIYGSDTWINIASLRPHIEVDVDATEAAPNFASLLLDSDTRTSTAISGYSSKALITVAPDGTARNTTKPDLASYTASRGSATVSSEGGTTTVSGGQSALLKLDSAMLGKTLLFNATLGGGSVEILTSPYATLADTISIAQLKGQCGGLAWKANPKDHLKESPIAISTGWIIDVNKPENSLIYAGTLPTSSISKDTITYSKESATPMRELHAEYWGFSHHLPASHPYSRAHSHDISHPEDHRYSLPLLGTQFPYYEHPGQYEIQHNSTSMAFPGTGLLLRDGARFHVAYEPTLESRMHVIQKGSDNIIANSGVTLDEPLTLTNKRFSYGTPIGYAFERYATSYPDVYITAPAHAIASNSGEERFALNNPSSDYFLRKVHTHYGVPSMMFTEGTGGNDDYASLAGIKFNTLTTKSSNSTSIERHPQTSWAQSTAIFTWGDTLCVIAERQYVVDTVISSDSAAHRVEMPERDSVYARNLYALVHTRGSTVTLDAVSDEGIVGLAPSVPYRFAIDGKTLHFGFTTKHGTIPFIESMPESFTLHTYPDAASYRGSFSTIIFDPRAGKSMRIATPEDHIYTVHTWAQIPVAGSVTVSDVEVRARDGTAMRLEYLDGEYSASEDDEGRMWVPVVPGYFSIHMKVNGVDAVLRYSDVLGGSNVRVIPSSTSTVSRVSFEQPIDHIDASAGASAYTIATSDRPILAIVSGTVSGHAHIEHTHRESQMPRCARDPLTGWVAAYRNGDLVYESERMSNYAPEISATSKVLANGNGSTKTTFTYDRTTISNTVNVSNVSPGDFVEFYIHANIYAESAFPSPEGRTWCGTGTIRTHVSSDASATANIHGGSIIIG